MDHTPRSRCSVGVAIVNWNAGAQLERCIASIASTQWSDLRLTAVVVVDNASSDGSLDRLGGRAEGPPLQIIRNDINRGFGVACNQAAQVLAADYLLFLNPDVVLGPLSIPTAVRWMDDAAHASTGIVGIQLVDERGVVSRSCARFPTAATTINKALGLDRLVPSLFASYLMEDWDHADSRAVDHVIGAFYLVRSGVFRTLGGFDESFFVYFEDLDFSLRARHAGWHSFYLTSASAFHKGGGTSDQIRSTRLFYSLRSRLLYARKHFSGAGATTVAICTLIIEPVVRLIACLVGGSPTGIRETIGAFRMLWSSPRSAS